MRLAILLLATAAAVTSFAPPRTASGVRRPPSPAFARPDEAPARRELDPVIGKAIVEKGSFFVAVIALAVLIEKVSP